MTAPHADQLIDGYLARLRAAAADLPGGAREELIDDMRAHIGRDKLIGTLVPPGGYIGLSYVLLAVATPGRSCVTIRDQAGQLLQNSCTGPPELPGVLLVPLTILVFGSPLISAAYLAIRLRWGRGRRVAATA